MSRLLKVTYAGVSVGLNATSVSYHLTGKYRYREEYTTAFIEFDVVVANATRATFLTDEAALIAAYTKPDQALEVLLGATTRHGYSPTAGASGNTGFLARPSITKTGSPLDTANSAFYRCRVDVQLPADLSGRSGRREAFVDLETNGSGVRTARVGGTYTALTTTDAFATYTAAAETAAQALMDLVDASAVWELVGKPRARFDDQNKLLAFEHVYREVVANQASGVLNHPAIVNPTLIVRREKVSTERAILSRIGSTGGSLDASALIGLRAEFRCNIDRATQPDLQLAYENVVRPRLLEAIRELSGVTTLAVVRDEMVPEIHEHTLTARVDCQGDPGTGLYQSRLEVEELYDTGVALIPVLDGNPFSRDKYDGPQTVIRRVRRTTVGRPGAISDGDGLPDMSGFVERGGRRAPRRFLIGLPGEDLPLEAVVREWLFERADLTNGASPEAGGDDTSGRRGGGGYTVDTEGV